ncbi:hypothetical protein D9M71_489370 [compost metagenome]
MEFQLLDRMSRQRFAGLKHSGRVPDRNTIWVFRERLVQANVEHQIFAEVQRQLHQHGFRAREGQIIKPKELWLRMIDWRPHIQRKGQSGKPIGERGKARNKRIASPRARVEQAFASLA